MQRTSNGEVSREADPVAGLRASHETQSNAQQDTKNAGVHQTASSAVSTELI